MKAAVLAAALATSAALIHAGEMKGMDMSKGDMKGMDMSKGAKSQGPHKATGVVKKVDAKAVTVTIDHEPVKTMSWPAMSMTFKVKDKAALAKLGEGKKAEFEFVQEGKDYVVTKVN